MRSLNVRTRLICSAIFFGICLNLIESLPLKSDTNRLETIEKDENNLASSEMMPGRYYTDQEIRNMIYLVQSENLYTTPSSSGSNSDKKILRRSKRFVGLRRTMEQRLQLRADRIKRRNERRRLRVESQRLNYQRRQQALQAFNRQAQYNLKRLQDLNHQTQQKFQTMANGQQINARPQQMSISNDATIIKAQSTVVNPPTQPIAVQLPQVAQTFQQVPLPNGRK